MKNDYKWNGEYWIGITKKGEEFYFDDDYYENISKHYWLINIDGYPMTTINKKRIVLHKFVFGSIKKGNVIDHINNIKEDNRINNLREVSKSENNKNKKIINKYGISGLYKKGGLFYSRFIIDKKTIYWKSQPYNEAVIDNLIIQKYFGFKHNESDFYIIDDVNNEYIESVMSEINKKLDNYIFNYKPRGKNKYEISECGTYYNVYDSKGNVFKISIDSLCLVNQGLWSVGKHRNKNYVSGRYVNCEGKILLHRYILGLIGETYSEWCVDHINGDELDNRLENLIITDNYGNQCNKKGKGYSYNNKYNFYTVGYMRYYNDEKMFDKCAREPSFKLEEEAIREVERRKDYIMSKRFSFKTKKELDAYLELIKL